MGIIFKGFGLSISAIGEFQKGIVREGTGYLNNQIGEYRNGFVYSGFGLGSSHVGEYENGVIYSGSGWSRKQVGEYANGVIYRGFGLDSRQIGGYTTNADDEEDGAAAASLLLLRDELFFGSAEFASESNPQSGKARQQSLSKTNSDSPDFSATIPTQGFGGDSLGMSVAFGVTSLLGWPLLFYLASKSGDWSAVSFGIIFLSASQFITWFLVLKKMKNPDISVQISINVIVAGGLSLLYTILENKYINPGESGWNKAVALVFVPFLMAALSIGISYLSCLIRYLVKK